MDILYKFLMIFTLLGALGQQNALLADRNHFAQDVDSGRQNMPLDHAKNLWAQNISAFGPEEKTTTRQNLENSKWACPAKEFSLFIRKFSDDEDIQRKFTQYPLTKQYLDHDAEPEPEPIIQRLRREQIQFPVMPLRQERITQALEFQIESLTALHAQIKLFKPDTDYQVLYFFEKKDCWNLVRIEDDSF